MSGGWRSRIPEGAGCLLSMALGWLGLGLAFSERQTQGLKFWLAYVGSTIAILALLTAGSWLWHWLCEGHRRCRHGIRGGITRSRCSACVTKRESERRESEARLQRRKAAEEQARGELERVQQAKLRDLHYLLRMEPGDFEDAVCRMYRALEYHVTQTPRVDDHGKDAILWKDGRKFLLECKRYSRTRSVGRPELQKFFAAIYEEEAEGGFFVTTSDFSAPAREFASQYGIELVPGTELLKVMASTSKAESNHSNSYILLCMECGVPITFSVDVILESGTCRNGHRVPNTLRPEVLYRRLASQQPRCEKCGSEMKLKRGRHGRFWGCSSYPRCRSTIPRRNRR